MALPQRVAAIGVSHWHARYDASFLPIVRKLGIEIVGMADGKAEVAQDHADEFGGKAFTDYREMVAETRPDFVVALGSHAEMPDTFRFLIDEQIPFLMEKPWAPSGTIVAELAAYAEEKGGWAAAPLAMRYSAWAELAKRMIENGDFGTISHIVFRAIRPRQRRYRNWHSEWMYDRAATGGGCMRNLGVHGMDLASFVTGEQPQVIQAVMSNKVDKLDVEEYALATLTTPSGIIFHNEVGYMMPTWPEIPDYPKNGTDQEQKVTGDKAVLRVVPDGLQILTPGKSEFISNPSNIEAGYPRAVREILEAAASGQPPPIGPPAVARATALIDDAYRLAINV